MDEMIQLLVVCAAPAPMFPCMMVVAIESRKRKRHANAPIGIMLQLGVEIGAEDYLNRFGRTMSFVSI
jgi:hypothetical protein